MEELLYELNFTDATLNRVRDDSLSGATDFLRGQRELSKAQGIMGRVHLPFRGFLSSFPSGLLAHL